MTNEQAQVAAVLVIVFFVSMGSFIWRIMSGLVRFLNAQADLADARAQYIRARTPTRTKPGESPGREPSRAPRTPHVVPRD